MADERDAKLQAAYRALGAEEPPRALDEAILAAARRDAGARPGLPGRTGRQRSYAPLATAAVLVLAVATVLNVQQERPEIASTAKLDAPAPVAANVEKDSAKAVGKVEAQPELAASRSERDVRQEPRARKAPEAFPPASQDKPAAADKAAAPASADAIASAPPPPPAAAEALAPRRDAARSAELGAAGALARQEQAPVQAQVQALEKRRESMAEQKAAAAAPSSAAPAAKPAPLRDQASVLTPEQELERIAGLRKEQKHDEADKALAEFRKRYPDFKIPALMIERVERR